MLSCVLLLSLSKTASPHVVVSTTPHVSPAFVPAQSATDPSVLSHLPMPSQTSAHTPRLVAAVCLPRPTPRSHSHPFLIHPALCLHCLPCTVTFSKPFSFTFMFSQGPAAQGLLLPTPPSLCVSSNPPGSRSSLASPVLSILFLCGSFTDFVGLGFCLFFFHPQVQNRLLTVYRL